MSDLAALRRRRQNPPFQDWKGSVSDQNLSKSVDSINRLIDQLISLGADPAEEAVRQAVSDCVIRFNDLDDGWITTIEREDIAETIYKIVESSGFDPDEDWIDDREW